MKSHFTSLLLLGALLLIRAHAADPTILVYPTDAEVPWTSVPMEESKQVFISPSGATIFGIRQMPSKDLVGVLEPWIVESATGATKGKGSLPGSTPNFYGCTEDALFFTAEERTIPLQSGLPCGWRYGADGSLVRLINTQQAHDINTTIRYSQGVVSSDGPDARVLTMTVVDRRGINGIRGELVFSAFDARGTYLKGVSVDRASLLVKIPDQFIGWSSDPLVAMWSNGSMTTFAATMTTTADARGVVARPVSLGRGDRARVLSIGHGGDGLGSNWAAQSSKGEWLGAWSNRGSIKLAMAYGWEPWQITPRWWFVHAPQALVQPSERRLINIGQECALLVSLVDMNRLNSRGVQNFMVSLLSKLTPRMAEGDSVSALNMHPLFYVPSSVYHANMPITALRSGGDAMLLSEGDQRLLVVAGAGWLHKVALDDAFRPAPLKARRAAEGGFAGSYVVTKGDQVGQQFIFSPTGTWTSPWRNFYGTYELVDGIPRMASLGDNKSPIKVTKVDETTFVITCNVILTIQRK